MVVACGNLLHYFDKRERLEGHEYREFRTNYRTITVNCGR